MTNREFLSTLSNKDLAEAIMAMYDGAKAVIAFKDPNVTISMEDIIEDYLGKEKRVTK